MVILSVRKTFWKPPRHAALSRSLASLIRARLLPTASNHACWVIPRRNMQKAETQPHMIDRNKSFTASTIDWHRSRGILSTTIIVPQPSKSHGSWHLLDQLPGRKHLAYWLFACIRLKTARSLTHAARARHGLRFLIWAIVKLMELPNFCANHTLRTSLKVNPHPAF